MTNWWDADVAAASKPSFSPGEVVGEAGGQPDVNRQPPPSYPSLSPWLIGAASPATEQGAPARVRAVVGSMPEENRAAALRKFYPNFIDMGNGNFQFADETGAMHPYNPPGLDIGDIASLPAEAAELAGGVSGGIAGAIGGPPGAIAGGAAGATAAREAVQRGVMRLAGVEDARTPGQQATDAAMTLGLNAAGPLAVSGIGAAGKGMVRGIVRGGARGRETVRASIDDMARFGTAPSLAQATQRPILDSAESAIARFPGGSGVIRTRAREVAQDVARAIDTKVPAGADPTTVGLGIARDVNTFATKEFRQEADNLYGKLNRFIPPDTAIPVTSTSSVLHHLTAPVAGAVRTSGILTNPTVKSITDAFAADASGGTMPYEALSGLRSMVGRRIASRSLHDDIPTGDLKQIYGAITRDLRQAAQAQGPRALRAFDRANQYYKAGVERIDDILQPLVAKEVPEKIFYALERAGKDGPSLLWRTRRSVSPEQWQAMSGLVVRRLGRATAGAQNETGDVFSFNTFLTNWNKLDKNSKNALFDGQGTLRADLDALARSAGRMRESSRAFYNTSGTAGATNLQNYINLSLGSVVAAPFTGKWALAIPATLVMGMVAANRSARLMTNPKFVQWLAQTTRIQPNAVPAQLGRLTAVAADTDEETKADIQAYVQQLGLLMDVTGTPEQ